mmetsp:Transcript_25862/g.65467  ORF Transcript_25862/g.65467 Transcript_25862/m.65467 type:complete len:528 (-) Transcript_25862:2705-4288(-)
MSPETQVSMDTIDKEASINTVEVEEEDEHSFYVPRLSDDRRAASYSENTPLEIEKKKKKKRPDRIHHTLPREPPVDKHHRAYIIFFLQGMGMLFPWNIFINASAYFAARFKESNYEETFENYFSICFMGSNLIFLAVSVAVQDKIPLRLRIALPLSVNMVIFLVTTILVNIEDVDADTLFIITIVCIFISGFMTAFLQGGIFGLAGQFAPKYTQAVMTGQGVAGLLVSVTAIVTTAAEPATGQPPPYSVVATSATVYFAVAVGVLVVALVTYVILEKLDITHYYRDKFRLAVIKEKKRVESVKQGNNGDAEESPLLTPVKGSAAAKEVGKKESGKLATVIKDCWPLMLSVFLVFFTTLSLFPSIIAQIQSVNNPNNVPSPKAGRFFGDIFVPFQFLLFNLFDWLGRLSSGMKKKAPAKVVYIFAFVRLAFFPLFMFSNISYAKSAPVFNNDAFPLVFMVFFAFSNGYFSSLCMMYGPDKVKDAHKDLAGAVMVLCLTIGLSAGSMFSFGLTSILCKCNPFAPGEGAA